MDLSASGPIQSAAFTAIGVGLVTTPRLTHSDAHVGRNTAVLLAATLLPLVAAQATNSGDRDRQGTTLLVSQVAVLPVLGYAFFALQSWYDVLRLSYGGLAIVLLLLLPLTVYRMWPRHVKPG